MKHVTFAAQLVLFIGMRAHPSQITPEKISTSSIPPQSERRDHLLRPAIIYDLRTGAVLSTVPLTRSAYNPHLFITTLQAAADNVGLGRKIVGVASLYTDSGYTTKSPDYEEQEQYFVIKPSRRL
jgi:hypothetical protein